MRAKRSAQFQVARPVELPQGADDRAVRRRGRAGGAAREAGVRGLEDILGEARLAHARVAGEQYERATAVDRLGQHLLQRGAR